MLRERQDQEKDLQCCCDKQILWLRIRSGIDRTRRHLSEIGEVDEDPGGTGMEKNWVRI